MKYVFIVNPIAGNDNKVKIFSRIKSTFRLIDDEMIIEETDGIGAAKRISAKYAKEYGKDCVIVSCGGDGTVHEIANGLAGTETPMLILPLGTGNDFAKKIYETKNIDVERVIKAFGFYNGNIKYEVKPIDLIDYNGDKCINVMSFGLDTIVETTGRKIAAKLPFLGHNAYTVAIVPSIMKPLHYKISFDVICHDAKNNIDYEMKADDKDYALFAICNASYYGGGFCPAPNSVLDDGLLDYALVDGASVFEVLPYIPKYSEGTVNQDNWDKISNGYIKSGKIWMSDGSLLLGNCDGENFDYNEVNFKVEPKSLKLCFIKY